MLIIFFNDLSIIKNTAHDDFNDKNLKNVHSIKLNSFPTLEEHLTQKTYVDQAISEGVDDSSLLRLYPDEKSNLDEQDSILANSTLTTPKTIIEVPTESYVDKKFNDPSIIKNTAYVDFNDQKIDHVRFIKGNSFPAVPEHLTAKIFVDIAIFYSVDESSLLRLDLEKKLNPDEQHSMFLKSILTSSKTILEIPNKNYVDSLHESSKNRRDLTSVFNDQDNDFDNNKLTNMESTTVNRNPSSDN